VAYATHFEAKTHSLTIGVANRVNTLGIILRLCPVFPCLQMTHHVDSCARE